MILVGFSKYCSRNNLGKVNTQSQTCDNKVCLASCLTCSLKFQTNSSAIFHTKYNFTPSSMWNLRWWVHLSFHSVQLWGSVCSSLQWPMKGFCIRNTILVNNYLCYIFQIHNPCSEFAENLSGMRTCLTDASAAINTM